MIKKIIMIIVAVLLPSAGFAGKVNVKRLNRANWIYFETGNFKVLTDAQVERALELVRELEDFKYFLGIILKHKQEPLSQKISVVAAGDMGTFKATGIPGAYAGIFTKGYGYTIFAQCDGFGSSSKSNRPGRKTVFHELVHLFIHNSFSEPVIPPWYDEGMAEYLSTYMERKGKVIIGDLSVHKNRFYNIMKMGREHEKVDIESLFKTSRADLNIFNTNRRHGEFLDKFYARALVAVHYMLADNKRAEQLYRYLNYLDNGFSIDESFKLAFDITFSELDNRINRYMHGSNIKGKTLIIGRDGIAFPDVKYKKDKISRQDALGILITNIAVFPEKMLDDRYFDKLINDVEKLYPGLVDNILLEQLDENPENIIVLSRTAHLYGRLHRYSKAVRIYEKAILLDETDAFTLNNYAWFLVTMDDNSMRNPARAIELARRTVAIEKSWDHLDTLAEAYYADGSFQMAINTVNEAMALGTGDNAYLKKQLRKFKKAGRKQGVERGKFLNNELSRRKQRVIN